jgi:uncharacterized protein (DUF2147 family)
MFAFQRSMTALCWAVVWVSGFCASERVHAQAKAPAARVAGDEILGEWWTENNEGRIRITRDKEGYYRGTTTCCAPEGKATLDVNNPKPELRNRSTVGIVLIWKLKYEDGEYVDGYVYNPRDGKTYRMEMKLIDRDTLKIRGYLGISLLGQSQVWKRARVDAKSGSVAPPPAASAR